ncbi:unnamed protein product [Prunus armeniaca]
MELNTIVEEDGHQQQTHKEVLLGVKPLSQARSKAKESIKLSQGFGWKDKAFQEFKVPRRQVAISSTLRISLLHKRSGWPKFSIGWTTFSPQVR